MGLGARGASSLALTRDDGSETAEVPLVATALEVAEAAEEPPVGAPPPGPGRSRAEPARFRGALVRARSRARRNGVSGRSGCSCSSSLAGIGWAAYLGSSLGGGSNAASTSTPLTTGTTPGTTATTATAATTAAAGAAVTGLTATSYDPSGDGGDGNEHPADTANVLDGNPATTWRTDTYRGSPEFNGSKPGVGLILTAPSAVKAAALRLQAGIGDWTGRVYTAPGTSPPASIAGWTPVSAAVQRAHGAHGHPADRRPEQALPDLDHEARAAETGSGFAASIIDAQLKTAA